jgi:fumarylacetoacetate (FAA) hydrolase family protein
MAGFYYRCLDAVEALTNRLYGLVRRLRRLHLCVDWSIGIRHCFRRGSRRE